MEVTLIRSIDLPPGTLLFPPELGEPREAALRLGTLLAEVRWTPGAPEGRLLLAPDLWSRLAVPYNGIRLQVLRRADRELELGPSVAVLYSGKTARFSPKHARFRTEFCFGHRKGAAGLHALACAGSIDWEAGTMDGYVLDNRPASVGAAVRTRFPIPAAVRLSFGISTRTARRLGERTENRTFNWVRGLDKYLFHTVLHADERLREYLPETRLLTGKADLAAMLARHDTVFVKKVKGCRGKSVARVREIPAGLEVSYLKHGQMVRAIAPDIERLMALLRPVVGRDRVIVQQGVDTRDRQGRAAHFRILLTKDPQGHWYCPVTEALASPDQSLVFTNQANGAETLPVDGYLQARHGLSVTAAAACKAHMIQICLDAATLLEAELAPVGILGFDLGRDLHTGQLWLFEANTVPGWGYSDEVEQRIARSLSDFALLLATWKDRLPT